jgi:hypothetical protein
VRDLHEENELFSGEVDEAQARGWFEWERNAKQWEESCACQL